MVTVNWMFDEIADAETDLGVGILEHILIGTPASPLRKALVDSGLGEDIAGRGLDDELRQPMFSIGLKGIDPTAPKRSKRLSLRRSAGLADKGIDRMTLEAALNTVEFRLRENNFGSFPRGIASMLRSLQDLAARPRSARAARLRGAARRSKPASPPASPISRT